MVARPEIAKQYVQEMLEKRDDIVGALVWGSVARGDATEASDIDLAFIVESDAGEEIERGGIDTWRDGVYIEAGLAPLERYGDGGADANYLAGQHGAAPRPGARGKRQRPRDRLRAREAGWAHAAKPKATR